MNRVHLGQYDNSWYRPGRSRLWQAVWFFLGLPILRSTVIPSSSIRVWLLRLFGAKIAEGVVIKPGVRVKYPWRLEVQRNCWLGEDCWIDNLSDVSLGNDVCISQGAYLCTGNHNWSDPHFGLVLNSIVLRDSSWVGAKAFIAPGVVLGDGAVAAAGSVVNRSIPDFEVHAGNPAQFVRRRRIAEQHDERQKNNQPEIESATV